MRDSPAPARSAERKTRVAAGSFVRSLHSSSHLPVRRSPLLRPMAGRRRGARHRDRGIRDDPRVDHAPGAHRGCARRHCRLARGGGRLDDRALASVPQTTGRRVAVARAGQAAGEALTRWASSIPRSMRASIPVLGRLRRDLRIRGRGDQRAPARSEIRAHRLGAEDRPIGRRPLSR